MNDIPCREERFNQRRVWEPFLRSAPTSDVKPTQLLTKNGNARSKLQWEVPTSSNSGWFVPDSHIRAISSPRITGT